eukprot:jgi/Chlat1/2289/Chrsp17S02796
MWRAAFHALRGRQQRSVSHAYSTSTTQPHSTSSLYLHHTVGGRSSRDSAAVSVGLMHALRRHAQSVGYFRPIDVDSPTGGYRMSLIRQIYGLTDSVTSMRGVTMSQAYEMLATGRSDELMEEILRAYEAYKMRHDMVLLEGLNFIAHTLGTPALLCIDVHAAATRARPRTPARGSGDAALPSTPSSMPPPSALAATAPSPLTPAPTPTSTTAAPTPPTLAAGWKADVVNATVLTLAEFKEHRAHVLGAIAHRVPESSVASTDAVLRGIKGMQYFGSLPDDPAIFAVQVGDVADALNAELLYGGCAPGAMSTEVSDYVIATLQLQDMLQYLPKHFDPSKGVIVLSAASRPDILLGMLALSFAKKAPNVAAVVVTQGIRPTAEVDELMRSVESEYLLPVFLASTPTYEAAVACSRVEGRILSTSARKIERAQARMWSVVPLPLVCTCDRKLCERLQMLFDESVDTEGLARALIQDQREQRMNPWLFLYEIYNRAKSSPQRIVLPEAASEVARRGLCEVILLGKVESIMNKAQQLRVEIGECTIVDPAQSSHLEAYGMTLDAARDQLTQDSNVFGTAMVDAGDADGMVSGAVHTTAATVRPALQIIKTDPAYRLVSSVFFMCLPDRVLVYGDCAINTNPTAEELARIAIASAETAQAFGIEPRVAMLSYATGDSNTGPIVQKVSDATAIARKMRPDLRIEGPMQYDAAVNPETARTKVKGHSEVAGRATVLIFPDLNTGNNTYKAVQQSTGAIAMGPVLQGLRKPVNDLSRGCTVPDIVNTVAITAIQAAALKEKNDAERSQSLPDSAATAASS